MCVMFSFSWKYVRMGLGALAAVVGFPFAIAAVEFNAAGIPVDIIAASKFYRGSVAVGDTGNTVVGMLQSIRAARLGYIGTAIVGSVGALLGKIAAEIFEKASEEEMNDYIESLVACLMSPHGGNLDPGRTTSLLKAWSSKGLDAVRSNEEKKSLIECLKKMAGQ